MEKALFKNIFLHKIFICQPIFKIFVALFKTFGTKNGDMLIFFLRSFRKVRFRKMQFLKDGVQTVGYFGSDAETLRSAPLYSGIRCQWFFFSNPKFLVSIFLL